MRSVDRSPILVVCLSILLAGIPAFGADAVPLPNPSFEDGEYAPESAPTGWTWHMQGGSRGRWEQEGHTGRCISLENIAHEDQAIVDSDAFPVKPFRNYRLSFRHKARDPIDRMAEVWIRYGGMDALGGFRNFTVTTTRDWQERAVEFTTPDITETVIRFVLSIRSENSKFYVDDLRLEDLGPAKVTPENITWQLEPTSVMKMIGGFFTVVDGPKTSRPITTVLPLGSLRVVNTAPPNTPIIDGMIGDVEYTPWASTIGPLRALSDGRATQDRTYAWVTCDEQKLYIAWKATYQGDAPVATIKPDERDGHVNVDDSVEVVLRPLGGDLVHFIGNSIGAIYDERAKPGDTRVDIDWNAPWEYKTHVSPGFWTGELAIAWTDLGLPGMPKDGEEWLFDFCRTSRSYSEETKWCWLNGVAGYVNPAYMGVLRFDSSGWGFNLEPISTRLGVNVGVLSVTTSHKRRGSLILGVTVQDENGKEVCGKKQILTPREGDLYVTGFTYDLPETAGYTFSMSVQDPSTGRREFELTVPLDAAPDLQVTAKVLPFRKKITIDADSTRTGMADNPENRLNVKLVNDGAVLAEADVPRSAPNRFAGEFSIEGISPGTYDLHAALPNMPPGAQQVIIPPKPEWLGNSLGLEEKVLPPFTPVSAKGLSVSVWNRVYDFGQSGLPGGITTAGKQILAAPVSATLVANGRPVSLKTGAAKLSSKRPTAAVVDSKAGAGPAFSARTTTEFDGMMKIDFTLDPGKTPLEVDRFTIRFPLKREHAVYVDAPVTAPPFHHTIDRDGWRMDRSFSAGTGEVWGRFWVGDDDRGIDFSFLSDEGWKPYDRPDTIQIERRGEQVHVDIHVLGKTRLDGPVSGSLLVTATPVRPLPKDIRRLHVINWDGRPMKLMEGVDIYGSDGLQACADLGVNMVMMSDHWANGYGRPEPFDKPNFRKLVDTAKRLGVKIVPYIGGMNNCWAERGPEAPYMAEWEQTPGFRSANGGRPDQALIAVAMTSANGGHDCLIWLLDKLIREYDVDGVYIDGAGWGPSTNTSLGFGYLDENGRVRPTSTILETRRLYKRVSALFLEHGKEAFIYHHASWMLAGPVDSFTSLHLTGEYLAYRANENTPFPEDYFRIENTGVQWGVPVAMLCYNDKLWQRYIANTFVYGCEPSTTFSSFASATETLRMIFPSWKAFSEFDVVGAEWIPFWKAGGMAQSENPAHKVSLYRHPKEGVLLLVANTLREPGTARIRLNPKTLGLRSGNLKVKVENRENQVCMLEGDTLVLPLTGDDLLILRL